MSWLLRPIAFFASLLLCCLAFAHDAEGYYTHYRRRHHDERVIRYCLTDLGTTSLPIEELSSHSWPISYAPHINNSGQIIYNDGLGGVLWEPHLPMRRLEVDSGYGWFHAINDKGTILVSFSDGCHKRKWLLWEDRCGCRPSPLDLPPPPKEEQLLFWRRLNDQGQVAGMVINNHGSLDDGYAVAFSPTTRQIDLLCPGRGWDISPAGYVLAAMGDGSHQSPYLWHHRQGALVLPDDEFSRRKRPKEAGYLERLITSTNSVYGTFFEPELGRFSSFYWDPISGRFDQLNLGGMRLSGLNSEETLVGRIGNGAVVRQRQDGLLYDLNRVIDQQLMGWHLIEATDINDQGQIVGYATLGRETHAVLLTPMRTTYVKMYYGD